MTTKKITTPTVELWPIENITPYELNVKKHDKEQVARICAAIVRSGKFDQPIVVNRDGVIIKGHGRRLAALELGMKQVPVVRHADLTPEEVRAMRLADNRAAISDIDTEMLRVELADMDTTLLEGIFDLKEITFMEADLGAVNTDAFVTDMGEVVADQRKDSDARVERAESNRVPLAKAFGFKDIDGSAQIHITRLMAKAEGTTGMTGAEALTAYLAAAV